MTYTIIKNKNTIDQLIKEYFFTLGEKNLIRAMKEFRKKTGFGLGYSTVLFKNNLDEYDESYKKIDDRHILFSIEKPAAPEDSEIYLSFRDFYFHLNEQVKKYSLEYPSDKEILETLLLDVKKGLDLE